MRVTVKDIENRLSAISKLTSDYTNVKLVKCDPRIGVKYQLHIGDNPITDCYSLDEMYAYLSGVLSIYNDASKNVVAIENKPELDESYILFYKFESEYDRMLEILVLIETSEILGIDYRQGVDLNIKEEQYDVILKCTPTVDKIIEFMGNSEVTTSYHAWLNKQQYIIYDNPDKAFRLVNCLAELHFIKCVE